MLVFIISLDLLAVQTVMYSLYTFHSSSPCRGLRPVLASALPTLGLGHLSIPVLDPLTQRDSGSMWLCPESYISLKIMSCAVSHVLWLGSMPNMSHLFCDSITLLNWQAGVNFSNSDFSIACLKHRGVSKCSQCHLCVESNLWRWMSFCLEPDTASR